MSPLGHLVEAHVGLIRHYRECSAYYAAHATLPGDRRCGRERALRESHLGHRVSGMRGSTAVTFGKEVVYAFVSVDGGRTRLRVSADECDRLDLFQGKQVNLTVEDGEQQVLVTEMKRELPFVWLVVEFPARSRAI